MKNLITKFPTFSRNTLKTIKNTSEKALELWLWRNIKKGEIIALKNGLYTTSEYSKLHLNTDFNEYIASVLCYPSYLSTEYVLSKYEMLTDITYGYTSITTKTTRSYENTKGSYRYNKIQKQLFTGFYTKHYDKFEYYEATRTKALFDYLYLSQTALTYAERNLSISEELRINIDSLDKNEWAEFAKYVELTTNTGYNSKMKIIFNNMCKNASNYISA